ncbi:DUF2087 domain-containing protein [Streptomyces sp. G-G2]|uniref:DUF2087 domain-containing protein n=1 Tax=Streptomyces sp. G-G2 TaxID=3046201 RepID=UPI0024BB915A|nr:DUF2087 domain-containing protein [Streptomyces sp. G-G2]MDJ0379849.1 DUF2087 domain-containing protein [Streptomyces sp. G-G2]
MSQNAAQRQTSPEHHGVADLFSSSGRLKAVPRKPVRRAQLLGYLSEALFTPDREYSESEVNEALRTVHDDSAALRRYLVIAGLLTRTRDGGSYRRATEAAEAR